MSTAPKPWIARGIVGDIKRRRSNVDPEDPSLGTASYVHFTLNMEPEAPVRFYHPDRALDEGDEVTVEWHPDGTTRPQRAIEINRWPDGPEAVTP